MRPRGEHSGLVTKRVYNRQLAQYNSFERDFCKYLIKYAIKPSKRDNSAASEVFNVIFD